MLRVTNKKSAGLFTEMVMRVNAGYDIFFIFISVCLKSYAQIRNRITNKKCNTVFCADRAANGRLKELQGSTIDITIYILICYVFYEQNINRIMHIIPE